MQAYNKRLVIYFLRFLLLFQETSLICIFRVLRCCCGTVYNSRLNNLVQQAEGGDGDEEESDKSKSEVNDEDDEEDESGEVGFLC